MHQKAHTSQTIKTITPFQLVHSDLWGPAFTYSSQGFKYYIHFVDGFTGFTWIFPLTIKSEAASIVKRFVTMVQCQFNTTIKAFQSDWGEGVSHFQSLGIHFQHPCPYIHSQNGKAERKHQHIIKTGLTLLAKASLPLKFWWDAFECAIYIINDFPLHL